MSSLGAAGSGVLAIDPDRVIEAAGALDELVADHQDDYAIVHGAHVDAGDPDMTEAAKAFATGWTLGLAHILSQQAQRAEALRKAVETLVGHDVDTAYAFRSMLEQP